MDRRLKKGIITIFLANIINLFFSLATNFLLPKYLSVESYAGIKTFQLYISYVGLLHIGYIDGMYLKYGGRDLGKRLDPEFFETISTMRVFQLAITGIVVIVGLINKDRLFLLFALSILPQNMNSFFRYLYQATGEFKLYGRVINITTISTFVVNMFVLFVLRSDYYLLYVILYVILYYSIWLALEFLFQRKHEMERGRLFSGSLLLENIKSGFLLTLGNLASMLLTSMDRWFIKILMLDVHFAQYSFAVSCENFLNVAITPVSTTLYNYFCREHDETNQRNILRYIIVFATILPSAAFPVKFIHEIFLNKYIESTSVVFLLFGAQMFYIIIKSVFVNLYKVERRQKTYFIKLVIVLVIGFVLNALFYYVLKTKESFAIATLCSAIIWFFISKVDFARFSITYREYIYIFSCLGCFLFAGVHTKSYVGLPIYLSTDLLLLAILMPGTMRKLIGIGIEHFRKLLYRNNGGIQ